MGVKLDKDSRKILLIKYKKLQEIESKIREKKKEIKRLILNKRYQDYLRNHWEQYKYYLSFSTNGFLNGIEYEKSDNLIHNSLVLNARRIWNNYRSKQRYYKKKLDKLIELQNNNCYFVTLTLSDEFINTLSREEIYKLLESKIDYFIINEDYGNNNRRHYHLVGLFKTSRKLTYNQIKSFWEYGYIFNKKVNYKSNLGVKVLNLYLTKLNDHSIKCSTKGYYVSKLLRSELKQKKVKKK